jgi:hypothetical protein
VKSGKLQRGDGENRWGKKEIDAEYWWGDLMKILYFED